MSVSGKIVNKEGRNISSSEDKSMNEKMYLWRKITDGIYYKNVRMEDMMIEFVKSIEKT